MKLFVGDLTIAIDAKSLSPIANNLCSKKTEMKSVSIKEAFCIIFTNIYEESSILPHIIARTLQFRQGIHAAREKDGLLVSLDFLFLLMRLISCEDGLRFIDWRAQVSTGGRGGEYLDCRGFSRNTSDVLMPP
jgi:hypothetical protein